MNNLKIRDFTIHDSNPFLLENMEARINGHVKLFSGGVVLLSNLGIRGKDLLCFILENLKEGQYEIRIIREDAIRKYTALAGDSYYVGLVELLNYGLLARAGKNRYYINCNCVFRGDRRKVPKR